MQNKYKTAILPNGSNIGGKNLITQQLYNHYNALLNAKPKIEVINLSVESPTLYHISFETKSCYVRQMFHSYF